MERFVAFSAEGKSGVEQRLAQKFGLIYAAGIIAVDNGILDWPREWPRRAITFCYENAIGSMQEGTLAVDRAIETLRENAERDDRFPKVPLKNPPHPFVLGNLAFGLRRRYDDWSELFAFKPISWERLRARRDTKVPCYRNWSVFRSCELATGIRKRCRYV